MRHRRRERTTPRAARRAGSHDYLWSRPPMGIWNAYICGGCGHDAGRLLEGGGDLCGRVVAHCTDCEPLVSVVVKVADAPDEEGDTPALAVLRKQVGVCPRCGGEHRTDPAQAELPALWRSAAADRRRPLGLTA